MFASRWDAENGNEEIRLMMARVSGICRTCNGKEAGEQAGNGRTRSDEHAGSREFLED